MTYLPLTTAALVSGSPVSANSVLLGCLRFSPSARILQRQFNEGIKLSGLFLWAWVDNRHVDNLKYHNKFVS